MKYNYIALDFDGTVVTHKFPEIGEPIDFIVDWIKEQQENGSKILLWTCRENGPDRAYLDEAVAECERLGIVLSGINENPFVDFGKRKMYADIYLDDRSVTLWEIYHKFK